MLDMKVQTDGKPSFMKTVAGIGMMLFGLLIIGDNLGVEVMMSLMIIVVGMDLAQEARSKKVYVEDDEDDTNPTGS